ncbi:hypothetical protein PLICRDRAFT_180714 [Plicaturopsis crispa FD-325 SS-3]|uniref:Unplaced genomic scaffold PLICRscaffold_30, whole genome shotgun sequence n=1 Tax=Plicaturopsis crispa FD-325 SS-3 TaxID=944288 RepID=A0A0C9SPY0_PLICR|nr:hypothetical protein PLICRDRAFT_180714 [Plicaturopsis crispa FD-325 SS-3]
MKKGKHEEKICECDDCLKGKSVIAPGTIASANQDKEEESLPERRGKRNQSEEKESEEESEEEESEEEESEEEEGGGRKVKHEKHGPRRNISHFRIPIRWLKVIWHAVWPLELQEWSRFALVT